jgi:LPXTG-motif cell wall-anchored protein
LEGAAALAAGVGDRARRAGVVGVLVLLLGVAGGTTLIVADASTVKNIETPAGAACEDTADPRDADDCIKTGAEEHGNALILLGVLAVLLAAAAGLVRSRPAAAALMAIGAVAAGIGLVADLPDIGDEGSLGFAYESANSKVEAGLGLYLEFAGAGLCVVAGALGVALPRRRRYS